MSEPPKARGPSTSQARHAPSLSLITSNLPLPPLYEHEDDPYTTLPSRTRRRAARPSPDSVDTLPVSDAHVAINISPARPWANPHGGRDDTVDLITRDDPRVHASGLNGSIVLEDGTTEGSSGGRKNTDALRIIHNRVGFHHRVEFLLKMCEALIRLGAPDHRSELLVEVASAVLEVRAEVFLILADRYVTRFVNPATGVSQSKTVVCSGVLTLGKLQEVYTVYWRVCHDDMSATDGTREVQAILDKPAEYNIWIQGLLAFLLAFTITALSFGGTPIDMGIAGCISCLVALVQNRVRRVYWMTPLKIIVVIIVSFIARGLSAIRSANICYNAVASSSIITILPGFLVLSASLEIAARSMVSGSTKMVWAGIYSMVLGFCLQSGSNAYLWFDRAHHAYLDSLSEELFPETETMGMFETYASDWNLPLSGEFSYERHPTISDDARRWIEGCFRPVDAPWYGRPLALQHISWLVLTFAIASALRSGQPWRRWDTLAMVLIAVAAFFANRAADLIVFGRGHVVSFIGAAACGVLGGGWARLRRSAHVAPFVTMAPGVLFLLPSGLAISGGITGAPDVITVGVSLVMVSIGISCGLLFSQSIYILLSPRRRTAALSF